MPHTKPVSLDPQTNNPDLGKLNDAESLTEEEAAHFSFDEIYNVFYNEIIGGRVSVAKLLSVSSKDILKLSFIEKMIPAKLTDELIDEALNIFRMKVDQVSELPSYSKPFTPSLVGELRNKFSTEANEALKICITHSSSQLSELNSFHVVHAVCLGLFTFDDALKIGKKKIEAFGCFDLEYYFKNRWVNTKSLQEMSLKQCQVLHWFFIRNMLTMNRVTVKEVCDISELPDFDVNTTTEEKFHKLLQDYRSKSAELKVSLVGNKHVYDKNNPTMFGVNSNPTATTIKKPVTQPTMKL